MRAIRLFLIFIIGCIFFVPKVVACSCTEMKNPLESFEKADAVFLGSVTDFTVQGDPEIVDVDDRKVFAYRKGREAVFRIHKIWKGPSEETMTVFTGEGGGDCGLDFIVGHEYLVYAYQVDGKFHTGICTRTQDVWFSDWDKAKEDFKYLNDRKK